MYTNTMATPSTTESTLASTSGTITPTIGNNATKTKSQSNNNNNSSKAQNRYNNYNYDKVFKGESIAMNGAVFEIHAEQPPKGQFQDTLDALKIYSSTMHKLDIDSLNVLFIDITEPTIVPPIAPISQELINSQGVSTVIPLNKFQETVYNEEIKLWIKDTKRLKASLTSLYNIVWGQCSKLMQNKLIAVENFSDIQLKCNVTELLTSIRGISNQIDTNTSVYDALDEAKRLYYNYKQNDEDTNAKHLKNFKNLVAIVEYYGGDLFIDKALVDHEKKSDINLGNNPKTEEDYETIVRDKMMAVGLLKRANKRKFHKLITNIHDQFAFNIDVYPTTLHASYELLENHSRYDNHNFHNGGQGRGGDRRYQRSGGRSGGRGRHNQTDKSTIELQYAQIMLLFQDRMVEPLIALNVSSV